MLPFCVLGRGGSFYDHHQTYSHPISKGNSMNMQTVARWAFIVGLVLAVIIAFVTDLNEAALWIMIILGVIAGWFFIAEGEAEHHFLLIAIGLVFFREAFVTLPTIGEPITALLTTLSIFFGVMVVAIAVRNIIGWLRPV